MARKYHEENVKLKEMVKNLKTEANLFKPRHIPKEELTPIQKIEVQKTGSEILKMRWMRGGGGEIVVLKTYIVDQKSIKKFKNELATYQFLTFPTITRVFGYSSDKESNKVSIVRELLQGPRLDKVILSKAKLTWKWKWNIVRQIITTINFLHSKSVIHRNIHLDCFQLLENKMDENKSDLRLIDLGMSKYFTNQKGPQVSSTPGISVCWRAPETQGFFPKWTRAADIFSLGFAIFAIATRKRPTLPTVMNFDNEISKGRRPPIPENVHTCFSTLIAKCWASKPTERPTAGQALKFVYENQKKF